MSDPEYPRTIQFSKRQFQYLVEKLGLPQELGIPHLPELQAVTVTANEERQLIDRVADRLQCFGFGPAYDVTDEGGMLESIIDVIAPRDAGR